MNMSNYTEESQMSALLGSGPGYIGFDSKGGDLGKLISEAQEEGKRLILLFDEMEKAESRLRQVGEH